MIKGITEFNEMEVEVKNAMVEAAEKVFLLADYTRSNKISFLRMMKLDNIGTIFTDKPLGELWEQFL